MLPREPGDEGVEGLLSRYKPRSVQSFTALPQTSWRAVCCSLSRLHGGQWIPREHGLTWVDGKRVVWGMEPWMLPEVVNARTVLAQFGLDGKWSIGSMARQLLTHIADPDISLMAYKHMWVDASYGYRQCRPVVADAGVLYDASAYYYTILSRLPSIRCLPQASGHVTWLHMDKHERKRWEAVLGVLPPHKLLRNAVWGAMHGTHECLQYYHKGTLRYGPPLKGPFRNAAMCVARAAWELCRDVAIDCDSVYTHTDCCLCIDGLYPQRWIDEGFRVDVRADGAVEVRHLQYARCGTWGTKYADGPSLLEHAIEPAAEPSVRYGKGWCYDRRNAA